MTKTPIRCENCIFVQYNTYDDTYECYNPLNAVMDTKFPGKCEYHFIESDLRDHYKGRSSSKNITSSWARAIPCKHVDEGYCKCEHLVESIRRSVNNVDYNPDCLFVGIWNQARVVCMAYESKVQRFEVQMRAGNGPSILGIFDSRERAEKFIKERIEIIEVE